MHKAPTRARRSMPPRLRPAERRRQSSEVPQLRHRDAAEAESEDQCLRVLKPAEAENRKPPSNKWKSSTTQAPTIPQVRTFVKPPNPTRGDHLHDRSSGGRLRPPMPNTQFGRLCSLLLHEHIPRLPMLRGRIPQLPMLHERIPRLPCSGVSPGYQNIKDTEVSNASNKQKESNLLQG